MDHIISWGALTLGVGASIAVTMAKVPMRLTRAACPCLDTQGVRPPTLVHPDRVSQQGGDADVAQED